MSLRGAWIDASTVCPRGFTTTSVLRSARLPGQRAVYVLRSAVFPRDRSLRVRVSTGYRRVIRGDLLWIDGRCFCREPLMRVIDQFGRVDMDGLGPRRGVRYSVAAFSTRGGAYFAKGNISKSGVPRRAIGYVWRMM